MLIKLKAVFSFRLLEGVKVKVKSSKWDNFDGGFTRNHPKDFVRGLTRSCICIKNKQKHDKF